MRARGALDSGEAHFGDAHAQRPERRLRCAQPRGEASDLLDAAAAAQHGREQDREDSWRDRNAVQDPRRSGAQPVGARHRGTRHFQSADESRFDLRQTRIMELLAKKTSLLLLGQYDAGTGLLLRQAFERQCKNLLSAKPSTGKHVVMYVDIDRLHVINETFGMHIAMRSSAGSRRPCSRCCRNRPWRRASPAIGLRCCCRTRTWRRPATVAETVRAAVAGITPRNGEGHFDVTASLGVALVGASVNPLPHALATAEVACKAAQGSGP